jgi:hypothetical protein
LSQIIGSGGLLSPAKHDIKRGFTLVLAGLCYPNGKLFLLSLTLSNFPFALMRSI